MVPRRKVPFRKMSLLPTFGIAVYCDQPKPVGSKPHGTDLIVLKLCFKINHRIHFDSLDMEHRPPWRTICPQSGLPLPTHSERRTSPQLHAAFVLPRVRCFTRPRCLRMTCSPSFTGSSQAGANVSVAEARYDMVDSSVDSSMWRQKEEHTTPNYRFQRCDGRSGPPVRWVV